MKKTIGYAAQSATSPLEPFEFELRTLRENDVHIEILYSSICFISFKSAESISIRISLFIKLR